MRMLYTAVAIFALMTISACNVYDFLHAEGKSDDVGVLLADGEAAQSNDDYAEAATIFWKVLQKDPDNSRAMQGYTTAIVDRDVELGDIPKFMTSIFKIDTVASNDYLADIAGRPGLTSEQYKAAMMATVSNACFWRAPIHGIDPATGALNTDIYGLPLATASDGVVSAHDRNALFNYLLIKAVHVALYVQQEFAVNGDVLAGINLAKYTNSYTNVNNDATFTNWHIAFTNDIRILSNTYTALTNVVLATDRNTSLLNLLGVADGFIAILSNEFAAGDISLDLYNKGADVIGDLKTTVSDLTTSLTNDGSGIKAGFDQLATFRADIETAANGFGWYPY
jgi:methyl-accepting chemotaxis protein